MCLTRAASPLTQHTLFIPQVSDGSRPESRAAGLSEGFPAQSTVARQHERRRENEIEKLNAARDVREHRECRVLLERIHTRREHLDRVRERLEFLRQDNIELRDRIVSYEATTMDTVQHMLQRCSRFVGSKQAMNRVHKADLTTSTAGSKVTNEQQQTELASLRKLVAQLNEQVLRDLSGLRELLLYRDKTTHANQDLKQRLEIKARELKKQNRIEIDELTTTIKQAMVHQSEELDERIDSILNSILTVGVVRCVCVFVLLFVCCCLFFGGGGVASLLSPEQDSRQ